MIFLKLRFYTKNDTFSLWLKKPSVPFSSPHSWVQKGPWGAPFFCPWWVNPQPHICPCMILMWIFNDCCWCTSENIIGEQGGWWEFYLFRQSFTIPPTNTSIEEYRIDKLEECMDLVKAVICQYEDGRIAKEIRFFVNGVRFPIPHPKHLLNNFYMILISANLILIFYYYILILLYKYII